MLGRMEFLVDALILVAWVLSVAGVAAWLAPRVGLPTAVCRLLAASGLGTLLGVAVAAPWPRPTPVPPYVEALGPHPCLAPPLAALTGWATWQLFGRARARTQRRAEAGGARARFWPAQPWRLGAWTWWPLVAWPFCFAPPWGIDAALYHLSLPLQSLLGHGTVPGHGNAGFFQLGEAMSSFALIFGSWPAARATPLLTLVWATQASLAVRPTWRVGQGLAAQALLLASPLVAWQLCTAYVDVVQAAFEAVALLALWRWHGASQGAGRAWLGASAWLLGAAVATKSMAALDVAGWWLAVALSLRHRRLRDDAAWLGEARGRRRTLAVAALLQAAPVAPYLVRNLVLFHAPLFPFQEALWPGAPFGLTAGQRDALLAFLDHHGPVWGDAPLRGAKALVALPYALVFGAKFSSPAFDGVVGPLPALAGLAWALGAWRRRRQVHRGAPRAAASVAVSPLRPWVLGFVGLRVAGWLASSWQARFLLGPLWWCAWAVATAGGRSRRRRRWVVGVALCTCVPFWPSLRGHGPHLDARAFGAPPARRALRLDVVPGSALMEAPDPRGLRVAAVWSQRSLLWCTGRVWSDSYDEGATLWAALAAEPFDPAAVRQRLRDAQIGTLVVDESLLAYLHPTVQGAARAEHAVVLGRWHVFRAAAAVREGQVGPLVRYRLRD